MRFLSGESGAELPAMFAHKRRELFYEMCTFGREADKETRRSSVLR
jgi:hypothetical protein